MKERNLKMSREQEIYKLEAMLQFALMHGDEEEAARLREMLFRLQGMTQDQGGECKPVWNGAN